jgi:tetratricopeptide (TPR) repeat protein
MRVRYVIGVWMASCFFFATAQQRKIDSLKKLINIQKNADLVGSYIELADLLEARPDDSKEYAQKALELSQKIKYTSGILQAKLWHARALANGGDTIGALKEFKDLHSLMGKNPDDGMLSDYYYGMGSFYEKQNDFDRSVNNYSLCIALREKILEKCLKADDKKAIEQARASLGYALLNMADVHENFSRSDASMTHYKRAIELLEQTTHRNYLSTAYNNMGLAYLNTGDYNTALKLNL